MSVDGAEEERCAGVEFIVVVRRDDGVADRSGEVAVGEGERTVLVMDADVFRAKGEDSVSEAQHCRGHGVRIMGAIDATGIIEVHDVIPAARIELAGSDGVNVGHDTVVLVGLEQLHEPLAFLHPLNQVTRDLRPARLENLPIRVRGFEEIVNTPLETAWRG